MMGVPFYLFTKYQLTLNRRFHVELQEEICEFSTETRFLSYISQFGGAAPTDAAAASTYDQCCSVDAGVYYGCFSSFFPIKAA